MLDAMGYAVATLFHPLVIIFIIVGVILGNIIGALPGISVLTAAALALPFIFKASPEVALPFLLALTAVGITGGSATAILINIPGDPMNAATLIDGYPMTKKGQGGRALGAAFTASALSGLLGVPMALLLIPLAIPLVMAFKLPELFFTIVLGVCFVGLVGGGSGSPLKGLISGGLGLLMAFVGFQSMTGIVRFTGGWNFLYNGFDLSTIVVGMFALPEVMDMLTSGKAIAKIEKAVSRWADLIEGAKDVFRHWSLALRSSIIGFLIGVIPGVGSMASVFIAYAQAKRLSKYPEKFGTGVVEGVIAPQAAGSSVQPGALLTTLTFGIPGSAVMAILLAGFFMVGIVPGPSMILERLPLSMTLLFGTGLACLIASAMCFLFSPQILKIALIHPRYLIPIILVLVFVGAYVSTGNILNVAEAIFFGVVGIFMDKFGYSRPAVVLGVVLGGLLEEYFVHAYQTAGPFFFTRPISMGLIIFTVVFMLWGQIKALLGGKRNKPSGAGAKP